MEEDFKSGGPKLSRGILRTGAVLHPNQPGAKKLARKYGDSLLCVRYRYDKDQRIRLITVELVEEVLPWTPRPSKRISGNDLVYIKIEFDEIALRAKVKKAQGFWDAEKSFGG